jgi:pSer/pThr/pTyr-binding forkhead associated (FHA) protein
MMAGPLATLPWHTIALAYANVRLLVSHAPFVIGRDSSADLTIRANTVSRRHARLLFDEDVWEIEDLGSRNGVVLNGRRLRGRARVRCGDRLTLGDVSLAVVPPACREAVVVRLVDTGPTPPGDDTLPVDAFLALVANVDHALLSGDTLEAERLFAVHLGRPAERAAARGKLDTPSARTVALLALRLGEASSSGVWLDFVLRLYAANGSVIPLPVVSGMHSLAQRLGGVDRSALKQYARDLARSRPLVLEERKAVDRIHALAATKFAAPEAACEWPDSRRVLSRRLTSSPSLPAVKLRQPAR